MVMRESIRIRMQTRRLQVCIELISLARISIRSRNNNAAAKHRSGEETYVY